MPEIVSVKEISRGVDWVTFRVAFTGMSFDDFASAHNAWLEESTEPFSFGCRPAEIRDYGFDTIAVFKFEIEPYSTEANSFYRYISAFAKRIKQGPGVSGTTSGTDIDMEMDAESGLYKPATESSFKTVNSVRVKSLISRITKNNAV